MRACGEVEALRVRLAAAEAALREKADVEAALRESEALRRIALEGGRMGTWRWNLRDRLIWGDAAFLALWGFPGSAGSHPLSTFTDRMSAQGRAEMGEMGEMVTRAIANREAFDGLLEVVAGPARGRWVRWRGVSEAERPWIVNGVSFDATAERRFDAQLRAREARQAFLLRLSDTLRLHSDPSAVIAMVTAALGRHLAAGQAAYAEADPCGDHVTVTRDWNDGTIPSVVGRHRLEDFGAAFIADLRQGRTVAIPDVALDPRTAPAHAAFARVSIAGFVNVPLVKNGRLVAVLGVHSRAPRAWSPDDVALTEEVAARTWASVERIKAEAALRESEARFRQFAEASSEVLWVRDADTLEWEYLSPAFETIYGLSVADALTGDTFRNWTDLIVENDRAAAEACIERVREGEHATFEYRVRRPDGGLRWLRNTDFPMRGADGAVERVGGVGQDVTELKRVEAALRESEGRMRTLMEGIPQLVWRSRDRGDWTWAGPQWLAFTGQSQEESHGLGWLEVVHPDDRAEGLRAWDGARRHGRLDTEFRVRRASDGAYLWHRTRSVPVRDPSGRILEWLGTTTDVDDLRRLQEEQAVMVAELQHRTRNLIAVVRSIAQQTMTQTGPGEAFRVQFNARLGALSRVQGLLSRAQSAPITIGQLVRLELDALGARTGGHVALEGPEVLLRPSVVQTLALALHELATNARKYGALSTERGRLLVRWCVQEPEAEGRRLVLDWIEHGIGQDAEGRPPRRGYGRELIERALPYALQARTRYVLGETDLHCAIDLPLTERPRKASP